MVDCLSIKHLQIANISFITAQVGSRIKFHKMKFQQVAHIKILTYPDLDGGAGGGTEPVAVG